MHEDAGHSAEAKYPPATGSGAVSCDATGLPTEAVGTARTTGVPAGPGRRPRSGAVVLAEGLPSRYGRARRRSTAAGRSGRQGFCNEPVEKSRSCGPPSTASPGRNDQHVPFVRWRDASCRQSRVSQITPPHSRGPQKPSPRASTSLAGSRLTNAKAPPRRPIRSGETLKGPKSAATTQTPAGRANHGSALSPV